MTNNPVIWFVTGSQHLYGEEALKKPPPPRRRWSPRSMRPDLCRLNWLASR
jgi:hypothetical protein